MRFEDFKQNDEYNFTINMKSKFLEFIYRILYRKAIRKLIKSGAVSKKDFITMSTQYQSY